MPGKKPPKPKKSIVPEGKFTTPDIFKTAEGKGLKVTRAQITEKLRRIREGREPWPEGIAQVLLGAKHRYKYLFPEQFVKELLTEAMHRKNLPRHLEAGRILPLKKLASDLDLKKDAILRYHFLEKLNTFMVRGVRYVTKTEATRFKQWYNKEIAGTQSSKGGKMRGKAKAKRVKPPAETPKRKGDPWKTLTGVEASWWLKNVVSRVTNRKKREIMRKLIERNLHLSHADFKKKVISRIDKMLEDKKKQPKQSG